jgi:hypothetical protein
MKYNLPRPPERPSRLSRRDCERSGFRRENIFGGLIVLTNNEKQLTMHIPANLKHITLLVLSIILPTGVIHAQEINTTARDSVRLRQQLTDANVLFEGVANGYTVHTRKDISGSVSFVGPSGLTAGPAGNVSNLCRDGHQELMLLAAASPVKHRG